ncbi:alcohol dehydrogenase catalytic domain-containing protein [Acidianus brierleyi]|uniref:Alcohol dehydrogenase n=1 Tax=Acidianus brierleyi TaxID=41673 RepID=A0A2U9IHV8_9CREN|nr:alcohol dehydrogenase catalytic domain-containing protein [Acidianus brierleyi]AWR95633.1 alcohol dehydrogenase catalytic domain-containing protein [Acidianus brierleyi]
MKAAVLEEFGKPLLIKDVNMSGNDNDVLVNIKSSGMCGRDIVIWKGGFRNLKLPLILGHEIFGELNGNPVGVFGTIVCGNCRYCREGKENLCENSVFFGEGRPGGYAESVYAPKDSIFSLPDKDYEKYAASVCPIATSIHASRLANVRQNTEVLVTGAGGGVGIHMIQYLKSLGAYVISITSESKKEEVGKFSDEVITEKEFSRLVKGVDVVMELVGSETINESLRSLSRDGTLVLIGNVSGKEISLKRPALTIMKQQRIIGSASYTRKEVLEAVDLIHDQKIIPIYKRYELINVNNAIKDLIEGRILGRAILTP